MSENGERKRKIVYTVIDQVGKKNYWHRVGSAFPNKDGSTTVLLNSLPMNGRLIIREEQEKDTEQQ